MANINVNSTIENGNNNALASGAVFVSPAQNTASNVVNQVKVNDNAEQQNNAANNINGHNKFTWLGENQFSSSLFSQSSEYINGLIKAIDKALTEKFDMTAKGVNLKIVKIDSTVDSEINGEFICIVMYNEQDNDELVGIHPLFIVDSKYKLQETPINYNGSSYLLQHVHSEVINETTVERIKSYVAKCVPFVKPTVAYSQTAVVFIDKINTQDDNQITNLLANSAAACHDALRQMAAKKNNVIIDINLMNDAKVEDLETTRTINNNVLLDSLQCPVNRTGFEVQFAAKRKVDNTNFGDQNSIVSKPIALVHGYVDVKPFVDTSINGYVPSGNTFFSHMGAVQNNQQNLVYGNVPPKNYFVANIVLTNLAQLRNHSLGNQLMTLAVTVNNVINDTPGQGLFWADILNPLNQAKDDMHSISGLTYEISTRENNLEEFKPMNVHSSKFDDEVYKVFMNQYFSPKASVSMLVARNGIDSWKYKTFVQAAFGKQEYCDLILNTADVLTDGKFKEIYSKLDGTKKPVILGKNIAYNGTYYNQQLKQRRSLQDISFSYLLNITDKKAQFFNDFVLPYVRATCADNLISNDNNLDQSIRLALQKYVIENVASDVEILGVSNELVFEAAFIQALSQSIKEVGVNIINKSIVNKAIISNANTADYLRYGMTGNIASILGVETNNGFIQRGVYRPNIY